MLKYDMAKLGRSVAVHKPGTTVQLPKIEAPLGLEQQYLKVLRAMLRQIAAAVREDVLPVVEREMAQRKATQAVTQDALTLDVDSSTFERIKQLGRALGLIASDAVSRILNLEGQRHTAKFMETAKRTLGIDLSAVVRDDDLTEYLETAATRNAGLIQGLVDATIQRIQTTVTNTVLSGGTATELKKTLVSDFKFSDNRAKLIARDQISKTNADLNRLRHTQAGITDYVWRTSHDERVRPRHRACDGNTYEYGKPTDAEQGLPPGQPIQCRCVAQAIVEF